MILYNITFNIERDIHENWNQWIRAHYIPFVIGTDLFFDYKIFRLLNETENDGYTYSIQFFTDSLDKVELYLEKFAGNIVEQHNKAFRHKHVSFMTLLESVDD